MLWTIITVLIILWILGFSLKIVSGGLIHLLLVAALVILIIKLVRSGRES